MLVPQCTLLLSSPHPSPHQSQPHHTQYGVCWAKEARQYRSSSRVGIFGESGNRCGAVDVFLSHRAKNKPFKDNPVRTRGAAVSLMGTARASVLSGVT